MRVKAVLFDLGNTLLQYPMQGQWGQYLRERLEYVYSHVCDGATAHHVAPLTFASVTAEIIGGERARAHAGAGGVWRFEDRLREALQELHITCDEARLRAAIEAFYEPIHAATSSVSRHDFQSGEADGGGVPAGDYLGYAVGHAGVSVPQ